MQSVRNKGAVTLGVRMDDQLHFDFLYLDHGLLVCVNAKHLDIHGSAFQCRAGFGRLAPDIQSWGLKFCLEPVQSNRDDFH